jgi:hypothetical protein
MNKTLAGWIVAACVGAALGYFAGSRNEPASPQAAAGAATHVATDEHAGETPADRPAPSAATSTPALASSPLPTAVAASPAVKGHSAAPDPPGGKLAARSLGSISPLDKLVDSMSAYCTFDAGAGGQWPGGRIFAHSASWQGGPIEVDAIDLGEQTAQLIRHPWAIPGPDGVVSLHVAATNSGLHFSGFKPDGELIAMTVFGALDSDQHYRAVLSLHGTKLDHESAQFYGWCTVR